jgi:hypothetical protein
VKPVPSHIARLGPPGTEWHGGPVDRTSASLRIACDREDQETVGRLLGTSFESRRKGCSLSAPATLSGDLEAQLWWLLAQTTSDTERWREVTSR